MQAPDAGAGTLRRWAGSHGGGRTLTWVRGPERVGGSLRGVGESFEKRGGGRDWRSPKRVGSCLVEDVGGNDEAVLKLGTKGLAGGRGVRSLKGSSDGDGGISEGNGET